ncbi:MAG TPA: 1,4-alpha-glucan branching protein GlgB [Chloroflexia bacterium]|jgi:1,4-alpha-glucan branching enzyme
MSELSPQLIDAIVGGYNGDPFAVLGPHRTTRDAKETTAVRVYLPWAQAVQVVKHKGETYEASRLHLSGFFEAIIPGDEHFGYTLRATDDAGSTVDLHDPYSFGPCLSDFDLHLIREGNHFRTYEKLGAHVLEVNGVRGVHFAVWAPNAQRVSVVGDFNRWDASIYPMRQHPGFGIWEIFIPGLVEGEAYKYHIRSLHNNYEVEKADPYGFYAEQRPRTASRVFDLSGYEWGDGEWMQDRSKYNGLDAPISIYEVHLGGWRRKVQEENRVFSYRELAHELVDYVKMLGYTHIELMPLSEHPYDGSWGYQTIGYYAVTSRYGTPKDFMYLVDVCHQNGIGVFIDWVPAHFPKDVHGLNYFDGTHLYEHADPRIGEHPDWGTLVFNFGRNEVRNFLLSNALFWLDKYHIDGLRVDAVASMLYLDYSRQPGQWVPNRFGGRENLEAVDFLKRFNELVHLEYPSALTMAEESTAWPMVTKPTFLGGLGFDMKWNMGWMNDMLKYMEQDPVYRRYHHNLITFSLMYAFNEQFLLPLSHDEVVHLKKSLLGKMPGDEWRKFANLRALFGYMFTHPGKKLLFMGGEFGQRTEFNEQRSLDWHELSNEPNGRLLVFMRDLLHAYRNQPALYEVDFSWEGFQWLIANDSDNSIIAFARKAKDPDDMVVVVCNFTPLPRYNYRLPVPRNGYYREILNSDSSAYWGSNVGNAGGLETVPDPWSEGDCALYLTVPPLSVLLLKPDPLPATEPVEAAQAWEAATEAESPQAIAPTPETANAAFEPTLRDLNLEIGHAEQRKDVDYLAGVLSDDLTYVDAQGKTFGKPEYLASIATPSHKLESVASEVIGVNVTGDTADVVLEVTVQGKQGRKSLKGTFRHARTFVRRQGSWQVANWVITKIAAQ